MSIVCVPRCENRRDRSICARRTCDANRTGTTRVSSEPSGTCCADIHCNLLDLNCDRRNRRHRIDLIRSKRNRLDISRTRCRNHLHIIARIHLKNIRNRGQTIVCSVGVHSKTSSRVRYIHTILTNPRIQVSRCFCCLVDLNRRNQLVDTSSRNCHTRSALEGNSNLLVDRIIRKSCHASVRNRHSLRVSVTCYVT